MSEYGLAPEILLLLFCTGLIAGMVDAIAGGGGLITLPVLLAAGLGPTEALATNKLQGSFGTLSSSLYFIRRKMVNPREIAFLVVWRQRGTMSGLRNWALLIPTVGWGLFAVWEWAVSTFSPEANIRVDLLCLIPGVLIASVAGIWLTLRK